MNKIYTIKIDYVETRLDRWFRKNISEVPQSLIEKNLRKGKIKVNHKKVKSSYIIQGTKLIDPVQSLDCGNSGTSARLLIGLLAGQGINAEFNGDASLLRRPMNRIIDPLTLMGAKILSELSR